MLDDQFYYQQENSLDILLKFSTDSQNQADIPHDYFDCLYKDQVPTELEVALPLSLFDQLPLPSPPPTAELTHMQTACEEQEAKMAKLLQRETAKPKALVSLKRKASECTEAPNSPLRKTKPVKKEKQ